MHQVNLRFSLLPNLTSFKIVQTTCGIFRIHRNFEICFSSEILDDKQGI